MKLLYFLFLSISFSLFLSSCSEIEQKIKKKTEKNHQNFIFNMTHLFSDEEKNMSFPNWFDEEIIRKKNIKSIHRKIYPSSRENNPEEMNPKEEKIYVFDTDGSLKSVTIKQFYEYITVANVQFEYKRLKDEYGFSPVLLSFEKNDNNLEAIDQFYLFDKIEYQKNYLVYQNRKSGDYLFYMLKKEYWGTLSVDSIFDPNPKDKIIFGSPIYPKKKYFVENKVNESNVQLYSYSKQNFPIEIKTENFPFNNNRSIIYNKEGLCSGFIDSTFNDNEFLTRKNSSFVFQDDLPNELIHEKRTGDKIFIQVETFKYDFFE